MSKLKGISGLGSSRGWHGESIRHSLARSGISTGRVRFDMDEYHKGLIIESREHKSISRDSIEKLVLDHLRENPNYYKK